MSYSISDGYPLVEVPMLWDGQTWINDRVSTGHVKIDDVKKTREVEDNDEPNIGRRGSYVYPTARKSSTWDLSGTVRARSLPDLQRLCNRLESAFRAVGDVRTMLIGGEVSWFFHARPLDIDIPGKHIGGPLKVWTHQREFNLTLKLPDPRVYVSAPQILGPGAGNKTPVNAGSTDTDPVIVCPAFAGGDLTIQNNTLPGAPTATWGDVPAGDVEIDFAARTLRVNAADHSALQKPGGRWWGDYVPGLVPGANVIGCTAPSWGIAWFHAAEG